MDENLSSSSDSENDEEINELALQDLENTDHSSEYSSSDHLEDSEDSDSDNQEMRKKYDIRQNTAHSYLNSTSDSQPSTSRAAFQEPTAGTVLSIPLFFSPIVLLPGQIIPLTASGISSDIVESAMKKPFPYIGLLTADFQDDFKPKVNIGVLVQVDLLRPLQDGFNIVGSAKQRFRLTRSIEETEIETGTAFSVLLFTSNIEVEVLDEIVLPTFERDLACSFNRLSSKEKQKYLQSVFAIDSRILTYCSTAHAIQVLRKWLCVFIEENKFENAMERGLPLFSFWVAANLPISAKEKLEILIENSVDKRLKMEVAFVLKRSKLACNCGSQKFDVNDLINLSSESLGNCYVNPHGYVHDIFTSRKVQNVSYHGNAQTKFSWFAGYSWTIMNCSNCGCHMGWKFKSSKLEPRKFFGINRSAIQPMIEEPMGFDILN